MERLDQSPIFYLFLFIKRYLFLYNKRRQQLPHTWSFARPRVKARRTKWVHLPCQKVSVYETFQASPEKFMNFKVSTKIILDN